MNQQLPVAPIIVVAFLLLSLFILLLIAVFFLTLFVPWIRAFMSGTPVSVFQVLGMRLRGVPARLVIDALVTLVHRGHPHTPSLARQVESTYLAQRGLIQSSTHLADIVEKQMAVAKPPL
jgi:uncharacterized protein YqfA (UPF0365 family)